MPYKVQSSSGSFLVRKKHGKSRTFGKHSSRAKAYAQIAAIKHSEKRRKRRGD